MTAETVNVMPTTKDVIFDLMSNNVCKYCILRFLNEKNVDLYKDVENSVTKLLGENIVPSDGLPSPKQKKNNPCSACLGLLQLSDDNKFMEDVIRAINNAGYDSEDVTFALSLPITFLLRNSSIWLYISNKYLSYYVEKSYSDEIKKECNVVSVKEVWKWITAEKIAKEVNKSINNGVNGNFHVNINLEYEKDDIETSCLLEMFPDVFKNRSSQKRKFHGEVLTRKSVETALQDADLTTFGNHYPVPPPVPDCFIKCKDVECIHDSIFLAGRYNKLSRNLSQTPWLINGERRMASSVEEIIGNPVSSLIPNNGIKFSSSGREDVDVRTLGKGRPFVLDVSNPRKIQLSRCDLLALEKRINQSTNDVFVRDLQVVPKEDLRHIKLGEQEKTKTYACFCVIKLEENENPDALKEKLNTVSNWKNLTIQQRTPIRVLHRRPLAVRPKKVLWLKAEPYATDKDNFFFKLWLQVQAGTYIKEFVHGDFGRTNPNLSQLVNREVDILALDVEEVALHWPPYIEYNGGS